ncbi:F-box/FBD/LRR-repeat protein [Senna tora]|uniref:F-box/FBD/LRR-repeat protein n=1 Tax=Senna tora TaxID=362788 RepID=A0A834SN18_9FABA|nr:F-box/FBD/LRR-repeat protein [Senna tora]
MAESESESTSIDIISELPKGLQCKILSYLPFKEAVATSILSKSWMSLSLSGAPSLDFSDGIQIPKSLKYLLFRKLRYRRFARSVNSALDRCLAAEEPEPEVFGGFRLKCGLKSVPSKDVSRWIHTAVQVLGVEVLDFSLFFRRRISLAPDVFTSERMVVLRLEGIFVQSNIDSVWLPSLKILHMRNVGFWSTDCVLNLMGGCKNSVEELVLDLVGFSSWGGITWGPHERFPRLIRVTSNYSLHFRHFIPFKAFANAEVLQKTPVRGITLDVSLWKDLPIFDDLSVPSHLKRCYFRGFDTLVRQICLVGFAKRILENGRMMERITISCRVSKKQYWKNILTSFTRSSPACQFKFEHFTCSFDDRQVW